MRPKNENGVERNESKVTISPTNFNLIYLLPKKLSLVSDVGNCKYGREAYRVGRLSPINNAKYTWQWTSVSWEHLPRSDARGLDLYANTSFSFPNT